MASGMIGIIGAMDSEISRFLDEMEQVETQEFFGIVYYRGKLCNVPAVVCKSGVGKVNAAVCTQVLIDRYQAESVIFTGVAGALHPELEIGDLVISTECQQHDIDASPLGFPQGTIPFQEASVFPADACLIERAKKAGGQIEGVKVLLGKVLSGDQFISDVRKVKELREKFNGTCVEMEGAAVAHVCHLIGVPYVVIRSMSDRADHSAQVNFMEFTELAAERSCAMVRNMLLQMAEAE
ncbi:5'-methylthioadenosine/adenosylhomocysteine nucleosidase [Paenactinomyces guangxiensis]|uniref:adenosylhomocysteine nucleosidase n=1 Tax=Paenactinomyces guangxiensis TaxID=1490290 RepID=A0A7W1WMX1_9BACL|nr:5'-methylthioadenosine/adenosylhomocysteine nucleosidase [Paenactinomyces guangxiensis]MBA4492831.1 5'-methylthioadenosine/adenosylhomocysteine nucleosidase [Paenactinomyces guangxiensis]MBH8590320.1 5'-methylthioadenosine/adenosylhomocysteine nucleosidase [Paenactinomyces guangxiensis]